MCGIFGYVSNKNWDIEKARKSLNTLQHRGPDQNSDCFDSRVYLGHRRLSILDVSENGKQPMASNDNVITVNGEIYNFAYLKKELQKKYVFKSQSDSEVLLHGYTEWGIEKLLEKIEGMFAFCIYDTKKKKVFLARDRVGIKPLYFSNINNEYIWASELKAIQNYCGEENLEKDYTSYYDFLTYLYIPAPKTAYKNVYKIKPGQYVSIDITNQTHSLHQYWRLQIAKNDDTLEEATKKIYNLVNTSVQEQLMSDVPLGFFLSGGLDSSAVVAMAAKNNANVHTYSIGFNDSVNNETHYAELVAGRFHTIHKMKMLDLSQTQNMYDNIKTWYDEPFGDTSCFPSFLVSQFAKEEVTVVLTGDGGDEIFGGYNWYKSFEKYNHHWKIPYNLLFRAVIMKLKQGRGFIGKTGRFLETNIFATELELYTRLMGGMLNHEKKQYKKKWGIADDYDDYWYFRKYYRKDLDLYTRLQYLDFHTYLPDDILTKVDRVSMAVSLECRVPLLSTPLIEYLFSLPTSIRLYNGELKGAMKLAFKNTLPDEILKRDKKGFSIPFKQWKSALFGASYYRQEVILKELFKIK